MRTQEESELLEKKAEAFDRIAEAFLKIPAGEPSWSQSGEAVGALVEQVAKDVMKIHPAYQGVPAEGDRTKPFDLPEGKLPVE